MGKDKAPKSSATASGRSTGFTSFQDAIMVETIRKENRFHKTHETYVPPPNMKKGWVLTEKPNNVDVRIVTSETAITELEKELGTSGAFPRMPKEHEKLVFRDPLDPACGRDKQVTMSEEIGWYAAPLMRDECPLFKHPRVVTTITLLYGPRGSSLPQPPATSSAKKLDKKAGK
ncbi:hypothetical protein CcCBS67573_g04986 [Chytriomyces confervae]|uniref:Uncharacterized protein n=1 Tax=Chytriomyces confervae TaxID=246404 RepID=A0A507FBL7_9FUNG|nr:hypothetical protein HDU80_003376 [Chytriomyces hyalinus]TPX73731.1 hypothetical protein CcCBS67573_g04986 [Chytriomyces confervae]